MPAPRAVTALLLVLSVLALTGCGAPPPPDPAAPAGEAPAAPAQPPSPRAAAPPAVSEADRAAGLRARTVPEAGTGTTAVVPGSAPGPPGRERTVPVRFEIERGLAVDGAVFAGFVLGVLNDGRSWGGDGSSGFARTDGDAPLRVVLAGPGLADRLCLPLDTRGRLSCRNGDLVVINLERWVTGTPEYSDDLPAYRRYLVNHEVGHWLGHSHESCPAPGSPAPVMQQQTLGLDGCRANSWPR